MKINKQALLKTFESVYSIVWTHFLKSWLGSPKLNAFMVVFFCLYLGFCAPIANGVKGRVIDENGRPIEGAIVNVTWRRAMFPILEFAIPCIKTKSTTTDKNGYYHIGFWMEYGLEGFPMHIGDGSVSIYSPGHHIDLDRHDGIRRLKTFSGTREQKFKEVVSMRGSGGCSTDEESARANYRFESRLYREAIKLAVTEEEKEKADYLGYNAAQLFLRRETRDGPHTPEFKDDSWKVIIEENQL